MVLCRYGDSIESHRTTTIADCNPVSRIRANARFGARVGSRRRKSSVNRIEMRLKVVYHFFFIGIGRCSGVRCSRRINPGIGEFSN